MALGLEDRQQIEDLLIKYAYLIDVEGTQEQFLSIFTDDAVLDSPISGHHAGIDGLREFYRKVLERRGDRTTRHLITNFVITIDGDSATLKAYLLGVTTSLEPRLPSTGRTTELLWAGSYDCALRRIDGHWKFERRTVSVDTLS